MKYNEMSERVILSKYYTTQYRVKIIKMFHAPVYAVKTL